MSSPLEIEILHILLEAGEENLPTVLNTVLVQHLAEPREALLARVEKALESLERQSYTELNWYKDGWVPLTAEQRRKVLPLANSVEWNTDAKRWHWKEEELGPERPIVTLTDKGEQYIRSVLRERG